MWSSQFSTCRTDCAVAESPLTFLIAISPRRTRHCYTSHTVMACGERTRASRYVWDFFKKERTLWCKCVVLSTNLLGRLHMLTLPSCLCMFLHDRRSSEWTCGPTGSSGGLRLLRTEKKNHYCYGRKSVQQSRTNQKDRGVAVTSCHLDSSSLWQTEVKFVIIEGTFKPQTYSIFPNVKYNIEIR